MTHIGYVLKVFPRLSQTFILHELRAHEAAGLPVTIFALRRPRAADAQIVDPPLRAEVVYLDGPDALLPEQLAIAARARGITHLHAHFAKLATGVAREAGQRLGVPYSFTAHARDIFDASVDQAALADRIRDAKQVVTVSRFNVDYLEHRFGRRAALVYNGLPLAHFPFTTPAHRPARLLAVGRLIEKKGFRDLIDACARLHARGVDFACDVVGDGALHETLAEQVAAHGLQQRVCLLGARSHTEVLALMREAAALVVPCVVADSGDRDGLPTVLLEAMALGTPCVGTDVTGMPEVLTDDVTGLVVPQHAPEALADACARLLDDVTLRVRLATAARAAVEHRFSSEANGRRLRALWGAAPLRVLFRVYNRRGLGHWMRGQNIARDVLALEPNAEVCFVTRSEAPFPLDDPRMQHHVAPTREEMDALPAAALQFAPDVIVDDTMPPGFLTQDGARHVFVMRRCLEERQAVVFGHEATMGMDALIVPHTEEEFGYEVPPTLSDRTTFVGPIVRRASDAAMRALRARLGLTNGTFCLVSTPGGGGFEEDSIRFVAIAKRVHALLHGALPDFRHVLVLGPNSALTVLPDDERMIVLGSEPEMASLMACADALLSAGGYNSVSEIRLAQRPAFFLPGDRTHDDQTQRVTELESRGLAMVVDPSDVEAAAQRIAQTCRDAEALAAMRAAYTAEQFEPGNAMAARIIVECARC